MSTGRKNEIMKAIGTALEGVSEAVQHTQKENLKRQLYESAIRLKIICMARVTGGENDHQEYVVIRRLISSHPLIPKPLVPQSIRISHSLDQIWTHTQEKFKTYKERRQYFTNEFQPLLDYLDLESQQPLKDQVDLVLEKFESPFLLAHWQKAQVRFNSDPEGAITITRTIIESVCKHILDKINYQYDDRADLPDLYKATAKTLNLSPDQHTEKIFKQILSGTFSVVSGLGALRNKHSDSHGTGLKSYKPATRHAQFAMNIGMAVTVFLLQTYEQTKT